MVHQVGHVPGPSLPHVLAGTQQLEQPPGTLRLVLQGNRWLDNPSAPRVRLNGYPVPASYGDNLVSVPAGRLDVDVHCRLVRQYGEARLAVEVPPGETVSVFYAPPHHELSDGRLGLEPQQRPGRWPALGMALLAANLVLLLLRFLLG